VGHTGVLVVYIPTNTHTRFLGSEINCSHNFVGIIISQLDRGEAHIALIQHPILTNTANSCDTTLISAV